MNRIFDAWPFVGLIALPFVVLLLMRADVFARSVSETVLALQFLILLLHQTKEYVFPRKFRPMVESDSGQERAQLVSLMKALVLQSG